MTRILICLLLALSIACSSSKHLQESDVTTIYLVRHAEKADDGTKDPPLTATGQSRAQALMTLLIKENIGYIYSTDYKRTRQTAVPLSKSTGLPVKIYDPRALEEFAVQIRAIKDAQILVVGHSNTTPTLANHLIGETVYSQFDESEYEHIIKVQLSDKAIDHSMMTYGDIKKGR